MSKRKICSSCERPIKTCLCYVITQLSCNYQLIVLQDPKEAKHALSSAPILVKSIKGARLVIGEQFNPFELLDDDWQENSLLVFPSDKSLTSGQAIQKTYKHLILLDGTWRKVARLMHLNPWLTELPCIAINSSNESEYQIRKSPREDGLSTIEAAVHILNGLQPDKDFSPILNAFRKMIQYQIDAMGEATFDKNYQR
ncbi:MAG: DTW domain-containing protein [Oleispira sp.]|nr:DTW domain-containing protein [Oleispira sp.]